MREVLKWQENHLTGERFEAKCYKPNNGVVGKVKIDLMRDNNIISETFTENIIPIRDFGGEAYRHIYHDVKNGGNPGAYQGVNQSSSFADIVLATSSRDEDINNMFGDFGNCVGWCPRENETPGVDATRGIYNKIESYSEFTKGYYHAHMVYDFLTSQANGTFNSIWWKRGIGPGNKVPFLGIHWTRPLNNIRVHNWNGKAEYFYTGANGHYYGYDHADKKYYRMIDAEYYLNGSGPLEFDKKFIYNHEIELPLLVTQMASGDYVVIENRNFTPSNTWANIVSNFEFVKYNKDDQEQKRVLIDFKTMPKMQTITNKVTDQYASVDIQPINIFNVTDEGHVYLIIRHDRRREYGGSYYVYDKDKDDIVEKSNQYSSTSLCIYDINNETWILEPSFSDILQMRVQASTHMYSTLGNVDVSGVPVHYIRNGGVNSFCILTPNSAYPYRWDQRIINNNEMCYVGATEGTMRVRCHIHGTRYLITQNEYGVANEQYRIGGDIILTHGYSAHTKLPNPVTKTSADTMKITYDYYIQVPKIADAQGDYLTYKDFKGDPLPDEISK